jgi:hypothetical protein
MHENFNQKSSSWNHPLLKGNEFQSILLWHETNNLLGVQSLKKLLDQDFVQHAPSHHAHHHKQDLPANCPIPPSKSHVNSSGSSAPESAAVKLYSKIKLLKEGLLVLKSESVEEGSRLISFQLLNNVNPKDDDIPFGSLLTEGSFVLTENPFLSLASGSLGFALLDLDARKPTENSSSDTDQILPPPEFVNPKISSEDFSQVVWLDPLQITMEQQNMNDINVQNRSSSAFIGGSLSYYLIQSLVEEKCHLFPIHFKHLDEPSAERITELHSVFDSKNSSLLSACTFPFLFTSLFDQYSLLLPTFNRENHLLSWECPMNNRKVMTNETDSTVEKQRLLFILWKPTSPVKEARNNDNSNNSIKVLSFLPLKSSISVPGNDDSNDLASANENPDNIYQLLSIQSQIGGILTSSLSYVMSENHFLEFLKENPVVKECNDLEEEIENKGEIEGDEEQKEQQDKVQNIKRGIIQELFSKKHWLKFLIIFVLLGLVVVKKFQLGKNVADLLAAVVKIRKEVIQSFKLLEKQEFTWSE